MILFGLNLFMFGAFLSSKPEIRPGFFIFGGFAILMGVIFLGMAGFQLTRLYVAPELAIRKQCR
jgi:hypothetical protein